MHTTLRLSSHQNISSYLPSKGGDPEENAIFHKGSLWVGESEFHDTVDASCLKNEEEWPELTAFEDESCFAQVEVIEIERSHFFESSMSWFNWLDPWDYDLSILGDYLDKYDDGTEGSILYIKELHVHPAFRGRRFGLSLLTNVLHRISRSSDDTAFLFARQITSRYTRGDRHGDRNRSLKGLSAYYRHAGFKIKTRERHARAWLMACPVWERLKLVQPLALGNIPGLPDGTHHLEGKGEMKLPFAQ